VLQILTSLSLLKSLFKIYIAASAIITPLGHFEAIGGGGGRIRMTYL
jgi:hypothetical protein